MRGSLNLRRNHCCYCTYRHSLNNSCRKTSCQGRSTSHRFDNTALPGRVPLKLEIVPSSNCTLVLARNDTTLAFDADDVAMATIFSESMRMSPEKVNEPASDDSETEIPFRLGSAF
eukprot:SAG22_NODE_1115_length_5527_cov_2.365328_2_plen_116_part_00